MTINEKKAYAVIVLIGSGKLLYICTNGKSKYKNAEWKRMAVPFGYLSISQMNVTKQEKIRYILSSKFDSMINSGQDYKENT